MKERPKLGSPTGTSARIQPAPLHVGQVFSPGEGRPLPFGLGTGTRPSAAPSRCIPVPSLSCPTLEDALDVLPATPIVGDRLPEGVLDPGRRVQLGGGAQLV